MKKRRLAVCIMAITNQYLERRKYDICTAKSASFDIETADLAAVHICTHVRTSTHRSLRALASASPLISMVRAFQRCSRCEFNPRL